MSFATLVRLGVFAIAAIGLALPLAGQVSEDPELVGPGKILFEFDGLRLGVDRDRNSGEKLNSLAVGSSLMSIGLTSRLDLQLGVDLYLRESVLLRGGKNTRAGLGDVTVRTKWLVWDDEPSGQKLALIPAVKLPSNTGGVGNHAVEGALLVPWTLTKGDTTLGATAEVEVLRDESGSGHKPAGQASAYVSQELLKPLSVYAEALLAVPSSGFSRWQASGGVGVKFEAGKHLALEYEVVRGLNERATDLLHYVRIDWRW